jgi:cobalamin biosynthesis Mg chelatase CobN
VYGFDSFIAAAPLAGGSTDRVNPLGTQAPSVVPAGPARADNSQAPGRPVGATGSTVPGSASRLASSKSAMTQSSVREAASFSKTGESSGGSPVAHTATGSSDSDESEKEVRKHRSSKSRSRRHKEHDSSVRSSSKAHSATADERKHSKRKAHSATARERRSERKRSKRHRRYRSTLVRMIMIVVLLRCLLVAAPVPRKVWFAKIVVFVRTWILQRRLGT